MDAIFLDKYKDFWVLTSEARTKDKYSPYFAIPPVRIIPLTDEERLKATILELFAEKVKRIPRPDLNDPDLILGIKPKAFNLKSPRAYQRDARAFFLQRTDDTLAIEEWSKEKRGWHAEPIWKKEFKSNELDNLIAYLVEKVREAE